MSRFINFASNLLDGVDSMAKDSLIDQEIAAAAAERRRRRRRRQDPKQGDAFHGGSSAAEQSEGGISEDGSHYDAPVSKQHGAVGKVEGDIEDKDTSNLVGAGTTSAIHSSTAGYAITTSASKEDEVLKVQANNAVGEATSASAVTPPVKEDGGVWSDLDPSASSSPVPLSSHLRGSDTFVRSGNNDSSAFVSSSASGTYTHQRPSRLEGGDSVDIVDPTDLEQDGDGNLVRREEDNENKHGTAGRDVGEGYDDDDVGSRPFAEVSSASNASLRVHASLSPAKSPLTLPLYFQRQQDSALGALGDEDVGGSAEGGGDRVKAGDIPEVGSAMIRPTHGASSSRGGGGGGGGSGLGNLLRMGGGKARKTVGDKDTEALKAEAAELREEVEELSLELEDAEDRLRGQEMELQAAAEEMKRERAEARNREKEMEREMEEFRALQAEEKKVFLTNLSDVEKKLEEKERQADEARSAVSALEAFAMEREDEAARLKHEKEELLEELKGVRSGQDRSAEELREALTRAEADKEEAENRHRTWMRQAQARQTELEGTAAQLAEALAEANRRSSPADGVDGEGSRGDGRGGARASGARGTYSSDRERRALRDELESCQASLDLEQERARSLQQEVTVLVHDLEMARATEVVAEKQREEHGRMAADAFAKASRLEQQLEQHTVLSQRLGASLPPPQGSEFQIQSLSSKLLDKQGRLEESVRERATLSMKLKEALERASRAEQELQESRGDSIEAGGDRLVGTLGVRSRRRLGVGGSKNWSKLAPIAKHKKIASAVDVVDRQTLQAVVFLRNSSMARALFLGYLLLLHLWAFVILGFHSLNMKHNDQVSNGNTTG